MGLYLSHIITKRPKNGIQGRPNSLLIPEQKPNGMVFPDLVFLALGKRHYQTRLPLAGRPPLAGLGTPPKGLEGTRNR
jgi:hypothetical protein